MSNVCGYSTSLTREMLTNGHTGTIAKATSPRGCPVRSRAGLSRAVKSVCFLSGAVRQRPTTRGTQDLTMSLLHAILIRQQYTTKTKGYTMENIQWQAPPPAKGYSHARGVYVAVADALRKRSGQWAIVSEDSQGNLAVYIRAGKVQGFAPAGSFEAVSRANGLGRGRATVYARFIG